MQDYYESYTFTRGYLRKVETMVKQIVSGLQCVALLDFGEGTPAQMEGCDHEGQLRNPGLDGGRSPRRPGPHSCCHNRHTG